MNQTERTIKDWIDGLPEKLRGYIAKSDWRQKLERIALSHNLNDDQKESLKLETLLTLAVLDPAANFRANLVKELEVTYDQALKISYDINTQIFSPVMEDMKEVEAVVMEGDKIPDDEKEEEGAPAGVVLEKVPAKMVPDHNQMVKVSGPHMHSQTNLPGANEKPKISFGSIVDQKLSGLVRNTAEQTHPREEIDKQRSQTYKSGDPYREPLE